MWETVNDLDIKKAPLGGVFFCCFNVGRGLAPAVF